MKYNLNANTANEITNTIHGLTDCPVTLCQDGRVIVSQVKSDLGTFSAEAFHAQESNISVPAANAVYFPVCVDEQIPIGAVGVLGDPEVISRYGILIQKSVSMILRNNQIHGSYIRNPRSVIDYIMQALITGTGSGAEYIKSVLASYHIKRSKKYRIILVIYNELLNPKNIVLTDQEVFGIFNRTGSDLYTFRYPNEYILMVEDAAWKQWRPVFAELAADNSTTLIVSAGQAVSPDSIPKSYASAQLAAKSIRNSGTNLIAFEDLNLELITADLSDNVKQQFKDKNLGTLDDKEKKILCIYYKNNMSLKESADELDMHRNTLQYQLDKIREKSGLDPRRFQDAVILYLAMLI